MRARAGRHAKPESRPAALIMLVAGSLLALGGLSGILLNTFRGPGYVGSLVAHVAVPGGPAAALPGPLAGAQVPMPVSLAIPAIGVSTRLVGLGTTRQGKLQAPHSASVAGWYTASARPGAIGPSVIAGHFDSDTGQGVFYQLKLLRPGDRVYITRADGTVAVFTITTVRTYLVAAFPAVKVYGPAPYAALRLITCGGPYAPEIGSYLDNVVAYGYEVSGKST